MKLNIFDPKSLKMQFQMRSCVRGFAKGCLMGINAVFILISIFMVGLYVVDAKIVQQYGDAHVKETIVADVFMVATGAFLIATSCFGCLGAARENDKYLSLYMGLIILLMVLELMLGIFVSVLRYGMEFTIQSWMRNDFFRNLTDNEIEHHAKIWQQIQIEYECCGLNGPSDYNAMFKMIDISCCKHAFNAADAQIRSNLYNYCVDNNGYYQNGCENRVIGDLQDSNDLLCGVAMISLVSQAGAVMLAILLSNNLRNEAKVYKQTVHY